MNRANFFRTIAAFLAAPLAFSRRKPNVWDSPQGQYCLMLRAELERLGHFDDLREDWQEVERALSEGCRVFEVWPGRIESSGKTTSRVVAVRFALRTVNTIWHPHGDAIVYVDHVEWGKRWT